MGSVIAAEINPRLFWERYVVPQKMPNASEEEKAWPEYITFDPDFNPNEPHENLFEVQDRCSHDGNIINTYETIWRAFSHLVFMKVMAKKFEGRKDFNMIRYTMGHIHIENDIEGTLILPGGAQERGNVEIARIRALSFPEMRH